MDRVPRIVLRWAAKLALFLASCTAVWTLSLPLYVDALLALVLLAVTLRSDGLNLALLTATVVSCLCAINLGFLLLGEQIPRFYRAHEKYARPGLLYQPNVDDTIDEPHGDLLAIDPLADPGVREPRRVRFRTDPDGYRNPLPYHGQGTVLVGDSFVVGNGNDEPDMLSSILLEDYGIDTHNLAFPADPIEYERKAAWFLDSVNSRVRFIFFIYEGNDFVRNPVPPVFPVSTYMFPRTAAGMLDRYDSTRSQWLQSHASWLRYPSIVSAMARRTERRVALREVSSVAVQQVGPRTMAFYEPDNVSAVDPYPVFRSDFDPVVMKHISCVFFVPTKLRVYASELGPSVGDRLSWPAPGYQMLQAKFSRHGIRVIDLTDPLVAAAKRDLPRGQYVYWRDDTHWNGRGMRAVASAIVPCVTR